MLDEVENEASRSPEDYWAILRRRRWWLLLPLFICWLATWGVSWLLPNSYQSDALILVEQQKVPDQYVVPNVTVDLQNRLQSMTQQILSRTRLQATIDRFHLYAANHGVSRWFNSDDPVDQMRKQIKIDLVQSPGHPEDLSAFKIQYTSESPTLAQQVNNELTSLFIEENLKAQQELSENTTDFLANQLASARTKMEEQEATVAGFKAQHLGNLPSQLESNVQILSGLQAQLLGTQQALDSAKQQKLYLESLMQQYQSAIEVSGDSTITSPQALTQEVTTLKLELAKLRAQYTEDYPDIIGLKEKIAKTEKLKKQMDDESAAALDAAKTDKSPDPAEAATGKNASTTLSMMQAQSQYKVVQVEIQNYEEHEKSLESQISSYQARLNMTPETEQKLAEVSRGYEESKSNYDSLLQKQMQSQLATSLQQRQQGEQFRVIDPPSMPDKPSAPNHLLISLGGLGGGFALGIGLIVLRELLDVRVRQEKDLDDIVAVRVLVGIPRLSNPQENYFRTMFKWAERGAMALMVIVMAAGNLYSFYKG